jgi:hypothetical protein
MATSKIARTCESCGKGFSARLHDVERGYGRFCSRECRPKRKLVRRQCKRCNKLFDVPPSAFSNGPCIYCSIECCHPPLAERFWAHVKKTDVCWVWTASRQRFGYGQISARRNGKRRCYAAHIISYELHYGKVPEGMFVLHVCDNPPCVRPEHLFLGTKKDNAVDMVQKGRNYVPQAGKITAEVKKKAIHLVTVEGVSKREAARRCGVTDTTVRRLIKNVSF